MEKSNFIPENYIRRMDNERKYNEVYLPFIEFICANLERPRTILDVASGPGILACALGKRYPDAKITGIDISNEMIGHANKKKDLLGCENVVFMHANALETPFPDAFFDAIVCRGFLKVVEDKPRLLRECLRVLAKNGRMFFSDTYLEGISYLPLIHVEPDEYNLLEKALKSSLSIEEIKALFSSMPCAIYTRGISVYVVAQC